MVTYVRCVVVIRGASGRVNKFEAGAGDFFLSFFCMVESAENASAVVQGYLHNHWEFIAQI